MPDDHICPTCGEVHRCGHGYLKSHADWEAWRANVGAAGKGKKRSFEARAKISAARCRRTWTTEERLAHYLSRVEVDEATGCWFWTNAIRGAKEYRFLYEQLVGPIPGDLPFLDHLCGNGQRASRLCVNPAHLDPCTPSENRRRGNGPHFELRGLRRADSSGLARLRAAALSC